jgi:hypothetical protein
VWNQCLLLAKQEVLALLGPARRLGPLVSDSRARLVLLGLGGLRLLGAGNEDVASATAANVTLAGAANDTVRFPLVRFVLGSFCILVEESLRLDVLA